MRELRFQTYRLIDTQRKLNRLLRIVYEERGSLLRAWHEHFR